MKNTLHTDFEEYDSVKRWIARLNRRSGSPNTRRVYLHYLREFCEYTGMSPDELVEKRKVEIQSGDEFVKRNAEEMLDAWFSDLERRGLSRNTCVLAYNAIRSFYKANYLELKMEETPSSWPMKIKPGLTKEELRRMLGACSKPLHRAYILCQAQSGLGIGDLLKLTYGDVEHQLKKGADYIHLRLLRGKTKKLGQFDTFFGKMATQTLREYLATRRNLKPEGPLFPCTARSVNKFLRTLSFKAGLDWIVSSHDLRKFFSTQLKMTRVNDPAFNETLIEYWMGHALGKVRGAYFIPSVEEQLRLYKLAEERLEP